MAKGRPNRRNQAAREKIMPSEDPGTGTPAPPADPTQPQQQQQLIINAQYIKDLSFENPRSPNSLRQQTTQPSVDIKVDVKAQAMGPENYEVVLTINASAKIQDEMLFVIELVYGAIVTARNLPQEMLSAIMLVETPRLMFPFARNIIAETTRDGGFPPLMINPIDFGELLRRNAAEEPAVAQPAANPTA
jgi:preprotein translocase subunit SecB